MRGSKQLKINDDRKYQRRVFSSHFAGHCRVVGSLIDLLHVGDQLTAIEKEPIKSCKLEGVDTGPGRGAPLGGTDGIVRLSDCR